MTSGLSQYHTVVATLSKSKITDFAEGKFSQAYIDKVLDDYVALGYELFSASPVQDIGDGVTVMYVLKLNV